jgi:formamidopyrimidine-DNA glycosylase
VPELPEVEITRRSLVPALEGARILRAEVRHPRLARRQPRPTDVVDRLTGRSVGRLRRLGKFLIADLEGELAWVTHLGMSGRMQVAPPDATESPHTHVVVRTDRHQEIRMVDPRTFGSMVVLTPDELEHSSLVTIGPDALEALPRTPQLAHRLAGRRVAIKTLLLDQRFLAGLGNIYADEVLHRSGVRGNRPAGSLHADEVARMRAAVRPVLNAGLRWGGTSLADLAYLMPDGQAGSYVERLGVYGREDRPCRRCGTPILRMVLGGRSSFFCPRCQR